MRQDLRFAVRYLIKQRAFTAATVLTLALGIGVNAALFALADAVLLRPFPFADQDQLVIGGENQTASRSDMSYANFVDWRSRNQTFDGLAAMAVSNWTLTLRGSDPVVVVHRAVSGNLFDVLGVRAALGRTLEPSDDRRGAPPVIVISDGLWKRQFGGASDIVGRSIVLGESAVTIVGVMPGGFAYPAGAEAWTPLVPALAAIRNPGLPDFLENRGAGVLHVIGRLKADTRIERARADLDRIIAELGREHGREDRVAARLSWLTQDLLGPARIGLWALVGAVALLLLVACANVAGLMLVHGARRRHEFTLRMALGASRRTVARQLLAESLLVVAAATGAAILLAWAVLPFAVALLPASIPRAGAAAVDARVIAVTAGLGLVTALLCWLAPALSLRSPSLDSELRGSGRAIASGRARQLLVAFEIANAVVILTFAGLLYRSVDRLGDMDLGFDPDGLLAVSLDVPADVVAGGQASLYRFYSDAIAEIASVPGVDAVGAAGSRPLKGPIGLDSSWRIEGQAEDASEANPWVNTETVTPSYFAAMRIPLRAGRLLTEADLATTEPVVVVNQRLAEWAWPGESPIGKRLRVDALDWVRAPAPWWTVVGVVADIRYRDMAAVPLDVYVPFRQSPFPAGDIMVRSAGPAGPVTDAIRQRLRRVSPDGVVTVARMADEVAAHQRPWRANFLFVVWFAGLTVLLAAVGLYGMLASAVAQRTREIGVRLTLGATARRIVVNVLLDGARTTLAGVVVGVLASVLGARLIQSLLFEVSPVDAMTFIAVPLLLAGVALLACGLPAAQAARVDPAISLRAE